VINHYNQGLASTLGGAIKISEFVGFCANLSNLIISFYGQFHLSLEKFNLPRTFNSSKNGLNSFEHLIRNIDKDIISESDAQKIVVLLLEHGVINNQGEFDSKILFGNIDQGMSNIRPNKILITSSNKCSVKNNNNSIEYIDFGENYNKHKTHIIKLCKNVYNQLTTDH
jgi:hypothetical protein